MTHSRQKSKAQLDKEKEIAAHIATFCNRLKVCDRCGAQPNKRCRYTHEPDGPLTTLYPIRSEPNGGWGNIYG